MRGGHVESRKSAVAWAMRQRSVSLPRSSNRTGGFPASGFPIGFTMEHTDKKIGCKRVLRSMFPVLHSLIQQPRTAPVVDGVARLIANHLSLTLVKSTPEVRVLCSTGITRHHCSYDPVRLPSEPPPESDVEAATLAQDGPPPMTRVTLRTCRVQYPGGLKRVPVSIASPFTRPSPLWRRVGIRSSTFETCSDFTHVTARSIAQPPKAAFVTRLQPSQLPSQTARQLPEQIDNSPGGSCRHWSHAPSGRTP